MRGIGEPREQETISTRYRLQILRLRRVGYPLHVPSECKPFSNSLQIINKKHESRKKYDRVSSGNKGKCEISKLFSFQRVQNKWKLSVSLENIIQCTLLPKI